MDPRFRGTWRPALVGIAFCSVALAGGRFRIRPEPRIEPSRVPTRSITADPNYYWYRYSYAPDYSFTNTMPVSSALTPAPTLPALSSRTYRLDSISYSGPSPKTPLSLQGSVSIPSGPHALPSGQKNCDVNSLFSDSLSLLNSGVPSDSYNLNQMSVFAAPQDTDQCGIPSAGDGRLTVSFTTSTGESMTQSFCQRCPAGNVSGCVNGMLTRAIQAMNLGGAVVAGACP